MEPKWRLQAEAVRLGQERVRLGEARVSLETEAAWLKEHAEKANEEEQVLSDAQGEYDRKHEAFESPMTRALAAQEVRNDEARTRCDARDVRREWQETAASRLKVLNDEGNMRKLATDARVDKVKDRVRAHRDLIEELKAVKVRSFVPVCRRTHVLL